MSRLELAKDRKPEYVVYTLDMYSLTYTPALITTDQSSLTAQLRTIAGGFQQKKKYPNKNLQMIRHPTEFQFQSKFKLNFFLKKKGLGRPTHP